MASENRAASRIIRSTYNDEAVRSAAEQCREEIGGRPSIVFAFVSSDWLDQMDDFVEVIQVYGHAVEIVGCSADGFINTAEEDENVSGCSLLFLKLPDTKLSVLALMPDEMNSFDNQGIQPGGSWMTVCNPFLSHAEHWMMRWNSTFDQTPTFGGLASGGGDPEDVFVFRNHEIHKYACIGVAFRWRDSSARRRESRMPPHRKSLHDHGGGRKRGGANRVSPSIRGFGRSLRDPEFRR